MPRRGNHAESGLSIVELLTVLGILSLLMSLAISSQQSALAFVKRLRCQENLRQWGLATHFYVMDNNDYLPKDGSPNGSSIAAGWYVDLPKALGIAPYHEARWRTNSSIPITPKLWLCPSNRRRSNGRNLFHYCLNQHINGVGTGKQIQISNLSTPEKLVWLFDNGGIAAVAQQNNVHTNLHQSGANILFVDGHVSHRSSHQFWDFQTNSGSTNSPSLNWHPTP